MFSFAIGLIKHELRLNSFSSLIFNSLIFPSPLSPCYVGKASSPSVLRAAYYIPLIYRLYTAYCAELAWLPLRPLICRLLYTHSLARTHARTCTHTRWPVLIVSFMVSLAAAATGLFSLFRATLRKLAYLENVSIPWVKILNDESNACSGVNMSWALICVILNATKYRHQGSVELLAYDLP